MKHYLLSLLTAFFFFASHFSHAQFSDCYSPANWTTQQVNGGNGSINSSGAPANIVLMGPNATTGNAYTHYSITVLGAGTISFNWSVAHSDPGYDGFGYSKNGINTQLTSTSASGFTSVAVAAGDVFTFYGHTFDGCCGTFNATITNFNHPCCFQLVPTVTNEQLCVGDGNMTTLSATSTQGGSVSWSGGVSDGVPFMPPMGSTVYTATSTAPADCPFSVTVMLTNPPTVNASADDPTPCSGQYVTFTGSGATSYSWSDGIVNGVPAQVSGSGFTTYTVTGTTNGCSTEADITLNIIPQPTVNAMASDESICDGESVIFSSSGDAVSYSWGTSITEGVPYKPTMTTTFNVVGTNSFGCTTTDGITVVVNPLPVINAGMDQAKCEGEMVTLNGSGGVSYTWSGGVINGNPFSASIIGTTTYEVTGTDANGCEGSDEVTVTVLDAPDITGVVEHEADGFDGSIDATVTGGTGEYWYTWSHGFDEQDVWALTAGDYTLTVNDGNCISEETFTVLNVLGIEDEVTLKVSAYPNPADDFVTLQCTGTFEYVITDISGKIVGSGAGENKELISLVDFAGGLYLVTVKAGESVKTIQLVKN